VLGQQSASAPLSVRNVTASVEHHVVQLHYGAVMITALKMLICTLQLCTVDVGKRIIICLLTLLIF